MANKLGKKTESDVHMNDYIKMLSYNVCGLKRKVGDEQFLNLLNCFDIII